MLLAEGLVLSRRPELLGHALLPEVSMQLQVSALPVPLLARGVLLPSQGGLTFGGLLRVLAISGRQRWVFTNGLMVKVTQKK